MLILRILFGFRWGFHFRFRSFRSGLRSVLEWVFVFDRVFGVRFRGPIAFASENRKGLGSLTHLLPGIFQVFYRK